MPVIAALKLNGTIVLHRPATSWLDGLPDNRLCCVPLLPEDVGRTCCSLHFRFRWCLWFDIDWSCFVLGYAEHFGFIIRSCRVPSWNHCRRINLGWIGNMGIRQKKAF